MIKLEKTEVVGLEAAIRGMRNPMNSWDQSDSGYCVSNLFRDCITCVNNDGDKCKKALDKADGYAAGSKDLDLMKRLMNAGPDHRKFMRMMVVYVDITAPLYWWKEFDTYKVGTVANSCSTMHKLSDKEFELGDFSHEHLSDYAEELIGLSPLDVLLTQVDTLNYYRKRFIASSDKNDWWQMIQLLPSSYNQKRTVMLNYEVLRNMYHNRKNHKLDEWRTLCDWVVDLPYSELIVGDSGLKEEALKKAIDLLDYCPEYMFGSEAWIS